MSSPTHVQPMFLMRSSLARTSQGSGACTQYCVTLCCDNDRMQLAGNAIWAIIGYLKLVCVVSLSTLKNAGTGLVDREVSRIASEHHVRVPAAGGSGINLHIVQIVRLMKCGSVFLERYG